MFNRVLKYLVIAVILLSLAVTAAAQEAPTVKAGGNDALGAFLVASNDMTLYIFTNDTPGVSNCGAGCVESWPPYTVAPGTTPTLEAGIAGILGTITRDDGSLQVTYNDQPLYFFTPDTAPGLANGQGAGDVWFVIAVEAAPAAPADVPADAPAAQPDAQAFVSVGTHPEFGAYLMTSTGLTLYTFNNDAPNVSNCVGQCLELWPAFFTDRTDVIAPTVAGIPGTFGTFPREDGTFHITYNEKPLYFYSLDAAPGDVNGQGVGNVWFIVPAGVVSAGSNDELGTILTTSSGMTLYTFSNDTPGVSNCVGQCLDLWPAFTVAAPGDIPAAIEGIPGEFGTITRDDGALQVTRSGQPLYLYSQDVAPGDVTGQGVGNVWFVVSLDTVRISSTPELGTFLIGNNGMTLYTFANDEPGWSNCVNECAGNWPPLVVDAEGAAFGPANLDGTLATTLRADGAHQVTLNNQPLYFFGGDALPGETNGNGAGGVWSVAAASVIATTCDLTVGASGANLRQGPGTEFEVAGQVAASAVLVSDGQLTGADGYVWWRLDNGAWVRSDVVTAAPGCESLPVVTQ